MDNYIGKRLDGRYQLQEIIGIGGMAVVYKAYDNVEDRIVAVKILKDEYLTNEDFLRRFKNESRAISLLQHPNIVKVYDVSFGDLIQYIVMEYIDGITLKEYIEQNGSIVWKNAVYFTVQILRALQHAHDKGIIHRDVKPQNIMLLSDGTIKVTDFGIARFARTETQTITDKAIGSVHYISPEQARGEPTDEKADIYSVGVILYEMLTGQLPFEADSAVSVAIMQLQSKPQLPTSINPSIPKGLEQITMHAMQKDPEKRYHSAAEMLKDIEDFKRDPDILFDYDVYVDDAPTRFVDIGKNNKPEEKPTENKNSAIMILAGVASAFVIALIVLAIIFLPKLFNGSDNEVACPKFVGLVYEDIKNSEKYKDFNIVPTYKESNEKAGVIISQNPAEGRMITHNQKIKLVVSAGPEPIKMPDVVGKDKASAVSSLESMELNVKIIEKEDEEVEEGLVISTDPEPNKSVTKGSTVKVYVSSGKKIKYVTLPNVVGMDLESAKKAIIDAKLNVGNITKVASDKDKNTVVSQNPSPSSTSEVAVDSLVNLEVSSGEEEKVERSYKVTLDLPKDLAHLVTISATLDGVDCLNTNTLEDYAGKSFTFTVTSDKAKGEVIIMIANAYTGESPEIYKKLNINFETSTSATTFTGRYPMQSASE